MGHVYVEAIIEGKGKRKPITMFVDTGSTFSLIPESVAHEIGAIRLDQTQPVELLGGRIEEYPVAIASLEIQGRKTAGQPFLIGRNGEAILGVLVLEALWLAVAPTTGEVEALPHLAGPGALPGPAQAIGLYQKM